MQQIVDLAAATTSSDPLQALLQYGVLGIFAVILLMYTRSSITRERMRTDAADAQVRELNDYIRSELLPKQVEATLVYKQVAEVLEEAIKLISEMKIRDNIRRQQDQYPPDSQVDRRG